VDAEQRYDELAGDLAARHGEVELGKMFGMPCLKAGGKAIAGYYKGEMVFKLPDAGARERALALDGAHPFDPMGGRPMKEWVQVPAAHTERWAELAELALAGR
jgi:hypothetical protein